MRNLCALLLLTLATSARAQYQTFNTYAGSATVTNVIVTSGPAVQMDTAARKMSATPAKRSAFEICNDDLTANIFCGFNVNVSSTAPTIATSTNSASNFGRRIFGKLNTGAVPGVSNCWSQQVAYSIPVYCVSDSSATVIFTQLGGF